MTPEPRCHPERRIEAASPLCHPERRPEGPESKDLPTAEEILARDEAATKGGNIVFCVGSVLRGDDAAGPLLAKMLEDAPLEGWTAVDGGQTPENDLGYMRRLHPRRLVLVDAAAMGLPAGEVRRLTADDVAVQSLITTHTLPITYLLGELEQMCDELVFLGIQPKTTEFLDPVSPAVLAAVEDIYRAIAEGSDFRQYAFVNEK